MKQVSGLLLLLFLIGCTTAERGDVLLVTYTGTYTNGTMFDTNDPEFIGTFGKPASMFTPLEVTLGRRQVVKGFEDALYGMREGEEKQVTIKAADAYGTYDASMLVSVPKRFSVPGTVTIERTVQVPRETLAQEIAVGEVMSADGFSYNITGMNTTHITVYIINASQTVAFDQQLWNSTIIEMDRDSITYSNIIAEGRSYTTPNGPYTAQKNGTVYIFTSDFRLGEQYRTQGGIGRVTRENENTVYIDFNHPLAGHDLVFNITIESIERPE